MRKTEASLELPPIGKRFLEYHSNTTKNQSKEEPSNEEIAKPDNTTDKAIKKQESGTAKDAQQNTTSPQKVENSPEKANKEYGDDFEQ